MPPKYYKRKTTSKTYTSSYSSSDNATYLVIVESPSKCAKIESFLGDEYKCIASKGHIRHIDGLTDIDAKNNFAITFSIIDEKRDHVSFMRSCISNFPKSNIILATDDDREGEAIAWHICDLFDLPIDTTKRILFHEITKPAVQKAVKSPGVLNMNLVYAQHARQVLDMIVGFKISPFLWKHIHNNKKNGLSAGRCQTPALRLVYDNEKMVRSGEAETKYKTTGIFFTKNIMFSLNHDFIQQELVMDFLEKSKTFQHILSLGSPKESIRQPPKPFNTSNLLQTANNVLNMSPKETMMYCQQLYQAGHITYMRTDCQKYSIEFLKKASDYILDKWEKSEYLGNYENLEKKGDTDPHEAIRVTYIECSYVSGIEGRALTLYKLIWRNTVESCMAAANYQCVTASISAPFEHKYTHIIEIPIFLGWKIVNEKEELVDEQITIHQNSGAGLLMFFQSLKPGSHIPYNKIESNVVVSHRHSHYTESSLIKKLEDLGIGRPSTFAMIVDTIQERGYVKRTDIEGITMDCMEFVLREQSLETLRKQKVFGNEKNKLVIQPIGLATVEFLTEHFLELFDYDYTKKMEDDLDKVSNSMEQILWYSICKDCTDTVGKLSKVVSKMKKPTYAIKSQDGENYDVIFHQYGVSLRRTLENDEIEYKSVNPKIKIDMELLKAGKYLAEDLLEIKNNYLGKYEGEDIFIKTGKYGPYVSWGKKTATIKSIKKPLDSIVLEDVLTLLKIETESNIEEKEIDGNAPRLPPPPKNPNILRIINSDVSIRKGKFGPYIYYMPMGAKKPEFFNIGKYKTTFATCSIDELYQWIQTAYLQKS